MEPRHIFEIDEESDAGGVSYCWVEKRADGYHMFGNELGDMSGPCDSVVDAVTGCGFQFGMGTMRIACSIPTAELREILESHSFILENVDWLTINDEEVEEISVDAIIAAYGRQS